MTYLRLLLGILVLLTGSSSIAHASSPLLGKLAQHISVGSGLEGSFLQEKHLAFLQKPFVSSGEFRIDRAEGLSWHVLAPLESLMLIDEDAVLLDGQRVDDHGIGQLMALIMFGLMEGQLEGLSRYFDISGEVSASTWRLSLQPRSSRLKSALQRIELAGEKHLRRIEIFEQDDNRTVIVFSNVQQHIVSDTGHNAASPK